jgi:hypothetical protein
MGFGEAFLALAIPTGVAVWLHQGEILNSRGPAIPIAWLVVTLGVLGMLGASEPPHLSGTAEHQDVHVLFFYLNSGASAVGLALGLGVGFAAGMAAGQYTRERSA